MKRTLKNLSYFNDFLEKEDETAKKNLRHFKKEFELYARSFNLLSETINYLNGLTDGQVFSTGKYAVLFIMPRILQSMQSIRALILKGYYYDAAILHRSLVEGIGLCAYLALNEKEAKNWVGGKDVKIAKIELVNRIFTLSGKSVYGKLSGYVHTYMKAIASLIADYNDKLRKLGFQYTPKFDKERIPEVTYYPSLILAMLLEIFKDELDEKRKDIMKFLVANVLPMIENMRAR